MAPRSHRRLSKPVSASQHEKLLTSVERMAGLLECVFAELRALHDEQRVQLKRIGQLQADVDSLKKARQKIRAVA